MTQYQLLVDEFDNDYTHISASETRQNIRCQTPGEAAKLSFHTQGLHPELTSIDRDAVPPAVDWYRRFVFLDLNGTERITRRIENSIVKGWVGLIKCYSSTCA